jgi:hypothetical protein
MANITISHSLAQEIKHALDDALCLNNVPIAPDDFNPDLACRRIIRLRVELEKMLTNNVVTLGEKSVTMPPDKLKRKAKAIIALAHEVLNGLEDAA